MKKTPQKNTKKKDQDTSQKSTYLSYDRLELSKKCTKLENCGEGGFGTVDAYYDQQLQKVIAVKQVSRKATYLQEKRRLISLKQIQLDCVNDLIGFCDEEKMLIFELGEATLFEIDQQFSDAGHLWRETELAYLAHRLLKAIRFLRSVKSFHGDISPNNIMFFMDTIKFIDLGSSEIDNNKQYLLQYKKEFVNHEIKKNRQNYKYSDSEITTNEIFTLGKSLLYLALCKYQDKKEFILDVSLKKAGDLIKRQNQQLFLLDKNATLNQNYPYLKNIILKMMYPFGNLNNKNQNQQEINDANNEDDCEDNEPKLVKKLKSNESNIKKNQIIPSNDLPATMVMEESDEEEEAPAVDDSNKTVVLQSEEEGDEGEKKDPNEIPEKKEDNVDQKGEEEEEEADFQKLLMPKVEIDNSEGQDIDTILDNLIKNLTEYLVRETGKDELSFSQIIEESPEIRLALMKVRQERIDELLGAHDDPTRELVFLSTMSAADWRREIAQNMISDVLSSSYSTNTQGMNKQGIDKQQVQILIHKKILHIQKRILERKTNIEDSFVDALKDLIEVCKRHKEYHSQIECLFAMFLIYSFLNLPDEAKKQLTIASKKISVDAAYKQRYQSTITYKKLEIAMKSSSNPHLMKLIQIELLQQLGDLQSCAYSMIY